MSQLLFSTFHSTTKSQWKQQAIKDLKGKNFEETLLHTSLEGIILQPYYTEEDLKDIPMEAIQEAQNSKMNIGWHSRSTLHFENEKDTNSLIISTLKKGADAITLDFGTKKIAEIDLVKLLDKIKLSDTPIFFKTNGQAKQLIEGLQKFAHYRYKGGLTDDVLATWMSTGKWQSNYWKNTKACLELSKDSPNFKVICVGGHHFHNAGANAVQELAFTLASAVTYLDKLTDEGFTINELLPKFEFSLSIGTNYFMEIAKIRALRFLWSKVIQHWDANATQIPCQINCQTSIFFDAALSPYTNMLRATTEAMAATMGGCDSLSIHGFDASFKINSSSDEKDFSERIARNISVLLKEEAHLDKMIEPASGSYFIENLSNDLINSAWELFLQVEEMGGIMPAFEANFVQNEIERAFQKKIETMENGEIMVGVNKFCSEESVESELEKAPLLPKSTFKLLAKKRIAATFEKQLS